ncbi:hypothetical protein [Actinoplanes sp. NPDC051411]|uniref:hypothetical protein n=1 Tax=Actinoplanes sp. NPDC051411 TaxID=3155522 RepID=UPI00343EC49F
MAFVVEPWGLGAEGESDVDGDAGGVLATTGPFEALDTVDGGGVTGPPGPPARGTFDVQPAATRATGRRTDPSRTVRRMAGNPFGIAFVLQCDAASTDFVQTKFITVG